jgi:hypothetical protein
MTSLAEIEAAAFQLTKPEQQLLLQHLMGKIQQQAKVDPDERRQWVERLEARQASMKAGPLSMTSEQMLEESREDKT